MKIDIRNEIIFKTARSGGKGGQHVNKVETMVEGRWLIEASLLVTPQQKQLLAEKLFNRITADGFLLMKSQADRTQIGNKAAVVEKMNTVVNKALQPKKIRIASKIPKGVKERRLENKKLQSSLKEGRKKFRRGDY